MDDRVKDRHPNALARVYTGGRSGDRILRTTPGRVGDPARD
jgi:hypothetical protein